MSKLRALVAMGAKYSGAVNHERYTDQFLYAFEKEKADKESVYSSKSDESIESRMEILTGLYLARGADMKKAAYWVNLLTLCAYSYAIAKGRYELMSTRDALAGYLSVQEGDNLEIASVMSVQEASTLAIWD